MNSSNKIIGVGMSKTGTTTLARCFAILQLGRHKSYDGQLKDKVACGKDLEQVLSVAEKYKTLEDSPWYLLYKELDHKFPGSKFILTVRRDSLIHAKSSWAHGVRAGVRRGEPTEQYLRDKMRTYEEHNQAVMKYFADRPRDLLVVCWETDSRWDELCRFLELPQPDVPFPHLNAGGYRNPGKLVTSLRASWVYMMIRRVRSYFANIGIYRKIKQGIQDRFIT